jgi:hypothetical protein
VTCVRKPRCSATALQGCTCAAGAAGAERCVDVCGAIATRATATSCPAGQPAQGTSTTWTTPLASTSASPTARPCRCGGAAAAPGTGTRPHHACTDKLLHHVHHPRRRACTLRRPARTPAAPWSGVPGTTQQCAWSKTWGSRPGGASTSDAVRWPLSGLSVPCVAHLWRWSNTPPSTVPRHSRL